MLPSLRKIVVAPVALAFVVSMSAALYGGIVVNRLLYRAEDARRHRA